MSSSKKKLDFFRCLRSSSPVRTQTKNEQQRSKDSSYCCYSTKTKTELSLSTTTTTSSGATIGYNTKGFFKRIQCFKAHKRKIPCRKHLYKANGTSEQQEETTTKIDTTRRQTRNDNFSDDISVISPTKLIRNSQSIPLLSTNDSNNYHHEITTTPIASFYNSTSPFYSYKGENNLLLNGNNQNESCSLVDIEVVSTNDTTTYRSYTPNYYLTNIN
ncbi:unnamed protein product, partial [Didymodactylos carnosus]